MHDLVSGAALVALEVFSGALVSAVPCRALKEHFVQSEGARMQAGPYRSSPEPYRFCWPDRETSRASKIENCRQGANRSGQTTTRKPGNRQRSGHVVEARAGEALAGDGGLFCALQTEARVCSERAEGLRVRHD